jgi:hypothetical protein
MFANRESGRYIPAAIEARSLHNSGHRHERAGGAYLSFRAAEEYEINATLQSCSRR